MKQGKDNMHGGREGEEESKRLFIARIQMKQVYYHLENLVGFWNGDKTLKTRLKMWIFS